MFWDNVAWAYDIFADGINRKANRALRAVVAESIRPGETVFIPTGIALEVPEGCAGLVYARSGLACKQGLAPANKVGVVDSDYRGEINVVLHNHGSVPQAIENGERVAQLLITPVLQPAYEIAETLTDTARNAGGFGSTGK